MPIPLPDIPMLLKDAANVSGLHAKSPAYHREVWLLSISGWICIAVLAVFVIFHWDSFWIRFFLLLLLLLFSLFLLRMPADNGRNLHVYFGVQTVVSSLAFTQDPLFILLFVFLTTQATMSLRFRHSLIWILIFSAITLSGNAYRIFLGLHHFRIIFGSGAFVPYFVCISLINKLRRAGEEKGRLLTELTHAYNQLQEQTRHAEALAVSEERNRLSRELHDTLGHRLTISIVQLEGVKKLLERAPYREQVTRMVGIAHTQLIEGLDELRGTLQTLHGLQTDATSGPRRPHSALAVEDNPQTSRRVFDPDNLIPSLQRLIHEFAVATGVNLHTQLPDTLPRLSAEQSITIYRAVQEALTNTHKHARARNAWVDMETMDGALTLTMRNDGLDFVPPSNGYGGYGLKGMRERATQVGGTLDVTKPEEGGILLTLSLPFHNS